MKDEYYKKYDPFFGEWYIDSFIGRGPSSTVFKVMRIDKDERQYATLRAVSVPYDENELKNLIEQENCSSDEAFEYFRDILDFYIERIQLMIDYKERNLFISCGNYCVIPHTDKIGWDILVLMEILEPLPDIMRESKLNRNEVVRMGIDICSALEIINSKGMVHGAIRPNNIFLSNNQNYKLDILGGAWIKDVVNIRIGYSDYFPPELYNSGKHDIRGDMYSLGILMYRLLNGNRLPFMPPAHKPTRYADKLSARERIFRGDTLPAPAFADRELSKVILRACANLPENRYSSPEEMKKELLYLYDKQKKKPLSILQTIKRYLKQ